MYKEIARVELLRPIRSEEQYQVVLREVEQLISQNKHSPEEADYLEILCTLVEKYEDIHHQIPQTSTPLEILQHLLEDRGMNASDLGRVLGQRQLGSKILRGDRQLSKKNIEDLAAYFKVTPALFISFGEERELVEVE